MTDVLKIAMERRDKMRAEVAKLEDFIKTAEALLQDNGVDVSAVKSTSDDSVRASDAEKGKADDADATDVPRPSIIRRGLAS